MSPPVVISGLSAGYSHGHPVLRDIDLEVTRGEFLALIGPNGGGKTTLLKIMLGILRPWSGTVRIFGEPPGESSGRIGYVPQMVPWARFPVTVMDVTLMGRLGLTGMFRKYTDTDRMIARQNLERLGIDDLMGEPMDDLSGGQRQRVLIARALTGEPDLLLLDEPVASVDLETQESFFNLLAELNSELTIILVTHDVGAVSSYVRTIACINRVIVSHGETLPAEAVAKAYGCPFELVAHGVPHRVIGHDTDHVHTGEGP